MNTWRIREIEDEIETLERKLYNCSESEKDDIRKKIDDLKYELRRLKRKKENEEKISSNSYIFGFGIGSRSGNFGGFGGGGFGGGGAGGRW